MYVCMDCKCLLSGIKLYDIKFDQKASVFYLERKINKTYYFMFYLLSLKHSRGMYSL